MAANDAKWVREGTLLKTSRILALDTSLKAFLKSNLTHIKLGLLSSTILTECTNLAPPDSDMPSCWGSR